MTSKVQVWYATPETFRDLGMGLGASDTMPDPNDLMATHRMVREYEVDADKVLAFVFTDMQGERWSPNGEARFLIRSLGLSHTSMSVGDVAVVDGMVWLCDTVGWTQLHEGGATLASPCPHCGEAEAYPQFDAYGIPCGRMCEPCFKRKYRQDRYYDEGYAGESLEPEPTVGYTPQEAYDHDNPTPLDPPWWETER